MPDNEDYAFLRQLLASPETWSWEEAAAAKSALSLQEEAVASVHPKDERRRAAMQGVADELREALALWESLEGER